MSLRDLGAELLGSGVTVLWKPEDNKQDSKGSVKTATRGQWCSRLAGRQTMFSCAV